MPISDPDWTPHSHVPSSGAHHSTAFEGIGTGTERGIGRGRESGMGTETGIWSGSGTGTGRVTGSGIESGTERERDRGTGTERLGQFFFE